MKNILPLETPLSIHIEPARCCNIKCIYCSHVNEKESENQSYLSLTDYKKFINDFKQFPEKLKAITFCGLGEPLLNKDIFEMIKFSKEISNDTSLVTNALLLTPENSLKLIDAGISFVKISIQGLNADDYKKTCGIKIDFDKFLSNIKFFYDNRKESKLVLKIPNIIVDTKEKQDLCDKLFLDICDILTFQNIMQLKDSYNLSGIDIDNTKDIFQNDVTEEAKICPGIFFNMFIDAKGSIYPCPCIYNHRLELGNVKENDIYKTWHGKELKEFKISNIKGNIKNCNSCIYKKYSTPKEDFIDEIKEKLLQYYMEIK